MKKTNFRLLLAMLSLTGVLIFGLMSFKSHHNDKSIKLSPNQSPCNGKPGGWFDPGSPLTSLSSDFVNHNFGTIVTATTISFDWVGFCYASPGTPPWYTNQYIGVVAPSIRPSGTRIFSANLMGNPGITWQFTLYASGALYLQQTGGFPAGQATGALVSAAYLK